MRRRQAEIQQGENAEAVTNEETQKPDAEGEIDAELEEDSDADDDTAVVE